MAVWSCSLWHRSRSWNLCCARQDTSPGWSGPPRVTHAVLPSAWRTFSTGMGRSLTAPPNMRRTCSVWRSTGTRTTRFVRHTFHKLETRHNKQRRGSYLALADWWQRVPAQKSGHVDIFLHPRMRPASIVCVFNPAASYLLWDIRREHVDGHQEDSYHNMGVCLLSSLCHRDCSPL